MRIFLAILIASVSSCATLPQPPSPNACAVWARGAEHRLVSSGVWAEVLEIRREGRQWHQVTVFSHSDGQTWVYDPALDNGWGNYGGSYSLWTRSRDADELASRILGNGRVLVAQYLSGSPGF